MTTPDENPTPRPSLPEDGIGERIRQARELKGLSQSKLAELTKTRDVEGRGLPRSVLVGYESGKYKPGARELRVLSSALDMEVSALLFGTSSREVEEDIERARAALFGGLHADLPAALRIGLALMRLKPHEREAIGTLVHGLVVRSVKSAEEAEQLEHLAHLAAIDLTHRLSTTLGAKDGKAAVRRAISSGQGLDKLVTAMEAMVDAIP